jgi:hypothetical protein
LNGAPTAYGKLRVLRACLALLLLGGFCCCDYAGCGVAARDCQRINDGSFSSYGWDEQARLRKS